MSEQCKMEVWRGFHTYQCSRKAVKNGYCKQHHPDTVAARKAASMAKWQRENDEWRNQGRLENAAPALLDACKGVMDMLDGEFPGHPMTEAVRQAIKQAEGK